MSSTQKPVLEIKNITKTFGPTVALNGVDFELLPGEIHALAGENGAGKSTLMKVIDGIYQPDSGKIYFNGRAKKIKGPLHAQKLGVHFVHQEIALCGDVTVAENIVMAKTNASKKFFVNFKQMVEEAEKAISQLADIDPRCLVNDLSISNQQLVEIAKALVADCKILILDEPTAALTENESEILFSIMRKLKSQGISIIYISHRMAEIFSECDRISVFRDGQYVTTQKIEDTSPEQVVNYMVGRDIDKLYPSKFEGDVYAQDKLLTIHNFSDNKMFNNVSFDVYKKEIFGISGLIGAGRSELVKAICGLRKRTMGTVNFMGKEIKIESYQDGIANGIVYLSEDRKEDGVFLELSIAKNISALRPEQISKYGLINYKSENDQAVSLTERLNLKSAGVHAPVSSLSGGNQQKVAIAKMLSINPKLIILDEPTRGIDVGAKSEIHKMIRDLAESGVGVIVISSELPEVIGLSDRIMVMCEGENAGILNSDQINEETIMHLASGSEALSSNSMAS
ncbi:sugar ABC transporter ATP-binding protein [Reinekea sp.]|jgi:ribose transport system ATP-binding protein|uniref:sugar ABC transporter ATP-binding protein n=1 Tax=Reinekea sp. TaxID=1970455 RepID=UPI00398A1B68